MYGADVAHFFHDYVLVALPSFHVIEAEGKFFEEILLTCDVVEVGVVSEVVVLRGSLFGSQLLFGLLALHWVLQSNLFYTRLIEHSN